MRRISVRAIAVAAIGAVAAAGAVIGIGVSAANAADYDCPGAIDPASIVVTTADGTSGTSVNEQLRIDATWSVPDGATAGQTFGFTLPPEFARAGSTFSIPATDDPSFTVANCTVSTDAAPVVVCTLTDYVEGRTGIGGALWFMVKADTATENDDVEFIVDGTVTPVAIPGGGIVPGKSLPDEPAKWSSLTENGEIAWVLVVPGSKFAGAGPIVIDDQLSPADGANAAHRNLDGQFTVWSTDATNTKPTSIAGWSGEWNDDGTSFHLEIPGPIAADKWYMIKYLTVPDEPLNGATFSNVATINGTTVRDSQIWSTSGGGTGAVTKTGNFTIAKTVAGDGADKVPADVARQTMWQG